MPEYVNIAQRLRRVAQAMPDKEAVVFCKGPGSKGESAFSHTGHTYAELERLTDAAARGFVAGGIRPYDKTLIMIRSSLPFFASFFALFKIGATPVVIDPGMGGRRLLECVRNLAPQAMVGVPAAHAIRILFPRCFPGYRVSVTVGRRWFWGGSTWDKMLDFRDEPYPIHPTLGSDLAAILFTTGSTGPAKGVEYSHAALDRETEIIRSAFAIGPEDRDCATFPGFSLFSLALGMTAVVPDMNPTRPGGVNPPNILTPIQKLGCTFSFGSPALWKRVSAYAEDEAVTLPTLRRVVMAGAPAPTEVHRRLLGGILPPGGETHTPYGATEVMPVANIAGSEILASTAALSAEGKGVCIGKPAPDARVEIIGITDDPIPEWSDKLPLSGGIGEIAVQAPYASRHYHNHPAADALAKIRDGERFWHRMGDVGYYDDKGRLWFCGRKAHRVKARGGDMFTICCEAIFNRHPDVARSALVGVPGVDGCETPVIVIETHDGKADRADPRLCRELAELGSANPLTRSIRHILFHPGFPTDIRHNAKIRREDLAAWAAKKLGEN